MKESKITELIRGLSQSEFRKFGEFLNSPIHNKSNMLITFYNLINRHFDNLDSNTISVKNVALRLFEGEKNKDQNVRTLLSTFTKTIEKFLIYSEYEKYPTQQNIALIKALGERNINKSFEMALNEIDENLSHEFNRNIDYYYDFLTYKEIKLNYEGLDIELNLDKKYFDMADFADNMFIVIKLKVINTILSRKFRPFAEIQSKFWAFDKMLSYIEKNAEVIKKEHPTVFSEYKILMMVLKPEIESHFRDLEKHVFSNIKRYNKDELLQVYYSLTNYCINRFAIGETKFLPSLFRIYNEFEKNGFYKEIKSLQYIDFLNVILCAIDLKDIQWAEYFFGTYKGNLSHEIKRDTVNLAQGLLLFAERKYKDSIGSLSKVGYKNSQFYLKIKETLIKIYYEQKHYDSLETTLDAVLHYLKRHEDALRVHYNRYMLFLKSVKRLIVLNTKNKAEIKLFMKDLDKSRDIIGREWLIEKLIEMK
jgi:hypothetical protein